MTNRTYNRGTEHHSVHHYREFIFIMILIVKSYVQSIFMMSLPKIDTVLLLKISMPCFHFGNQPPFCVKRSTVFSVPYKLFSSLVKYCTNFCTFEWNLIKIISIRKISALENVDNLNNFRHYRKCIESSRSISNSLQPADVSAISRVRLFKATINHVVCRHAQVEIRQQEIRCYLLNCFESKILFKF